MDEKTLNAIRDIVKSEIQREIHPLKSEIRENRKLINRNYELINRNYESIKSLCKVFESVISDKVA